MDSSLRHPKFLESLLRSYLGRHQGHFHVETPLNGDVVLTTDLPFKIVIRLHSTSHGVFVVLSEWVKIEESDPLAGSCEWQAYNIAEIPVEDPDGFDKMEEQVAKSLLSPF